MNLTVTGSCFCLYESLGAILWAPLTIVFKPGPSTDQGRPWIMCQARIAATYPEMVEAPYMPTILAMNDWRMIGSTGALRFSSTFLESQNT